MSDTSTSPGQPEAARVLGELIGNKLRISHISTQKELARKAKCGSTTVSDLINAKRPTSWETVKLIAETLENSEDWIDSVHHQWVLADRGWRGLRRPPDAASYSETKSPGSSEPTGAGPASVGSVWRGLVVALDDAGELPRVAAVDPYRLGTTESTDPNARSTGMTESGEGGLPIVVGAVPDEPEHFVRREQVDDLKNGLSHGRSRVAVVTGMRGAGKTQLAGAYARHVLDNEGGLVGWVTAETYDTLNTGLAEISERLGVAAADGDPVKSTRRLRDHLNSCADRHLLVLDNAIDPDQLRAVLPTRGGTRIVITTTNQAMTRLADILIYAGTGFSREQAHAFLREATGITDDVVGERQLATELGCLPLALAAAAAAITAPRPRLTYAAYLQRLRSQPLPRALRRRDGTVYQLRTDQAILLSICAAEESTGDADLDTVVAWLLGLFALFAPSGVRRELLRHPDPALNELVDDAIERCTQYSLLNWSARADRLRAHRLTARVLLERAHDNGTGEEVLADALALIDPDLVVDKDQPWAQRAEGVDLVDQIEAIWTSGLPQKARGSIQEIALSRRTWAVSHLRRTASLHRAVELGKRNLIEHEQILGCDHPDTLTSRNDLAVANREAGRLDEAISLHERTLADRERILGRDHPDTLTSVNNLAFTYREAGRLDEAISLHKQNLADRERILGRDHPDTLMSRHNLAFAYRVAGRLDEAISLYERTCGDRERILGRDHPDTLMSRNNLAFAYRAVGRLDEAISLHEQTLADRERLLGHDHPNTLTARNNLAHGYRAVGRLDEAISLHKQTLADRERLLGHDHPKTLVSRNNLALIYRDTGRLDEAISLFERTLADRQRIFGPDNPRTLHSQDSLAGAYRAAGRLDEAISLYKKNLADRQRILSPGHPDLLSSRNNLASTYESVGRLDEAISLYETTSPTDSES